MSTREHDPPVISLVTSSDENEVMTLDRFDLTLKAEGQFRPGEPIRITAESHANLSTDDVRLSIVAPEIELAALSSWSDGFSYEVGRVLPAALSTVPERMERSATRTSSISVTPMAAGYYRVVATIRSTSPQASTHEGQWVRNTAVAEVWLLIAEIGGRSTPTFDKGIIPADYLKQPGPFRRTSIQGGLGDDGPSDDAPPHGPNPGSGDSYHSDHRGVTLTPGLITFRTVYYNIETAAYEIVPSADVKVYACTLPPVQFTCNPEDWHQTAWGYSDNSGLFYYECQEDYYGSVASTNAGLNNFQVVNGSADRSGTTIDDCGGTLDIVIPSAHARVFMNLRKTKDGSTSLFGIDRPFINVYLESCGTSYYSSDDKIHICPGDVWDERGVFMAAHEYGHAFHEKALDGNVASGSCPSPHWLDTESNLQCAYSEGFADYFAAIVRPDLTTYFYRADVENDVEFPGCNTRWPPPNYPCGGTSNNGAIIEAAVAAFLYDLNDVAVENRDSIAAPGGYVREIVRTCKVTYTLTRRANGVDEIAYCTENAINPSGYFNRVPDSYLESAAESGGWSSSRVHANWTWNMFEKP